MQLAATLIDETIRMQLELAASLGGFECTYIPSTTDIHGEVARLQPDILIMQLGEPAERPLSIQATLWQSMAPTSVIYIIQTPVTSQIVRAMHQGAITAIDKHSGIEQLVQGILDGSKIHQIRRRWITDTMDAAARVGQLTKRQTQVLNAIINGRTNKSIARLLRVSIKTIEKHRQIIHERIGVKSLPELVRIHTIAQRPLETAFGLIRPYEPVVAESEQSLTDNQDLTDNQKKSA